jgi:hypothetical protein
MQQQFDGQSNCVLIFCLIFYQQWINENYSSCEKFTLYMFIKDFSHHIDQPLVII